MNLRQLNLETAINQSLTNVIKGRIVIIQRTYKYSYEYSTRKNLKTTQYIESPSRIPSY